MSETGLRAAQAKMTAAGVHQKAIDVFTHYYAQLEERSPASSRRTRSPR